MVSSSRLFCSALKASDRAANFSRLSTAISCVILSIVACLNAISRSLAATLVMSEWTISRSCGASSWLRSVVAITERDRAFDA